MLAPDTLVTPVRQDFSIEVLQGALIQSGRQEFFRWFRLDSTRLDISIVSIR